MKNLSLFAIVYFTTLFSYSQTNSNTYFSGSLDLSKSVLDKSPIKEKLDVNIAIQSSLDLKVIKATAEVQADYGDPDLNNQPITYSCVTHAELTPAKLFVVISSTKQAVTMNEALKTTISNVTQMENENSPCEVSISADSEIYFTGNYNQPFEYSIELNKTVLPMQLHTISMYAKGNFSRSENGEISFNNVQLNQAQTNGMHWFAFPKDKSGKGLTISNDVQMVYQKTVRY